MATRGIDIRTKNLCDEREFIFLLLHDIRMVNRWVNSDLGIEYFDEDHHMILQEILTSYYEGFTLTRKTFREKLKPLPVPKDRIRYELAFNSCFSATAKVGDYIALEKKIRDRHESNKRSDFILNTFTKDMMTMDDSQLADVFRSAAVDITKDNKSINCDISSYLEQYVEFPVDAMPKILQPIILDGSKAYTCAKDYIGVSLLTTIAGCIGRSYQIKITDNWKQSPAIWSILIGKPSTIKSSFLQYLSKIMYQQEYEWNLDYERVKQEYEKDKQIYEKNLSKWKKNSSSLEDPPEKPKEPVQKCLIASDTTVEAIVQRMKDNPKGMIIIMDEIAGFFGGMNRYNMGSNDCEFYLQTWSGGSFKVDRKSTGMAVITDMHLSLCGTIQPERFRNLLGGKYQDNGMAARILPCYPKPIKAEFPNHSIKESDTNALTGLFRKCMELQLHGSDDWTDGSKLKPHEVLFSRDGLEAFKIAFKRLVKMEDQYAISNQIEGLYGKMRGYLARFSLVIHLVRYFSDEIQSKEVNAESVQMAEKLVYYFLAHANKIWVSDSSSKSNDVYNKIRRYAFKNNLKVIPVRKIAQLKLTKDTYELRDVIQDLSDNNLVVWSDDSKRSFLLN